MKKLNLNKEVIAKLNDDSMNRVEGGNNAATIKPEVSKCVECTLMGDGPDSRCVCVHEDFDTANTCMDY